MSTPNIAPALKLVEHEGHSIRSGLRNRTDRVFVERAAAAHTTYTVYSYQHVTTTALRLSASINNQQNAPPFYGIAWEVATIMI